MSSSTRVTLAAILGFLGVAAGAFGAHALRDAVTPDRLETFQTATRYQLVHAVALLGLGMGGDRSPWFGRAAWAFLIGTLVFSGSLYLLVLLDQTWLGAVTPLGGLSFMVGWLCLLPAARRVG